MMAGIGDFADENKLVEEEQEKVLGPEMLKEPEEKQGFDFGGVIEFLKTEPGPGSVDSYIENPFNWKKSYGIAQMLRGLTGFLGNLNFAIVDIFVGYIRYKQEVRNDTVS